jgi:hypothetical protein
MNLKSFYGCLAVLSTLAATQSIIFPRWPQPSKISAEKITNFKENIISKGYEIKLLPALMAYTSYNISSSPISRFTIDSNSKLFLTNVQVRDRKNLQVSYITDTIKSLQLNRSAKASTKSPVFLSEIKPDGTTFQTCLVPNSLSSNRVDVNQDQLSLAVDSAQSNEKNLTIKRFLGMSPSRRYECMLITLKTTLVPQESAQLWTYLLNQLQKTFT